VQFQTSEIAIILTKLLYNRLLCGTAVRDRDVDLKKGGPYWRRTVEPASERQLRHLKKMQYISIAIITW